jgi:L-arabinose isomerase
VISLRLREASDECSLLDRSTAAADRAVRDRFGRVLAAGESVPGPILEIGNTNSRYRFSIRARRFVESWNVHGPAHHYAVGLGHIAGKIEKFGQLLPMEVVQVC